MRSVEPGTGEPPSSLVMDRTGIYYDARQPSDFESLLDAIEPLDAQQLEQARQAIDTLRTLRLSKYNAAPLADPPVPIEDAARRDRVLVVDQTFNDASVTGALAGAEQFEQMLDAAMRDNLHAKVVVKLHPETVNGTKRGYLVDLARQRGLEVIDRAMNPWDLFATFGAVYTVSSGVGFEALMAGVKVTCFGVPFYAGWGLTDDRIAVPDRRKRQLSLEQLVHAMLFRYMHYFDAWTRQPVDFFTAADQLAFLRDHYLSNDRALSVYAIARWKRPAIDAMSRGIGGPARYFGRLDAAREDARERQGLVAAWGRKARRLSEAPEADPDRLVTIEDGFLRSVGLGASFAASMSYVFDRSGIYYDPGQASDLETVLREHRFDDALIARAARLRQAIVSRQLTKYNPRNAGAMPVLPGDRRIVLVPGQVADDESIRLGARGLFEARPLESGGANLALLEGVRHRDREAFIVYKPHPDVSAGLRAGSLAPATLAGLADAVAVDTPITQLIEAADRVEVATSLAGFEALLRGKPVTVHGQPFYAGWGLTEDLVAHERRGRQLNLDELVAGALIVYPRYADPLSGRACPVEVILERLHEIRQMQPGPAARLREAVGFLVAFSRYRLRLRD